MHTEPEVTLGRRTIGESSAPYIIAEAGVNHNGDAGKAKALIEAAKHAGADAVKFQVFSADRLVQPAAPTCNYQRDSGESTDQHAMLRRLELSRATFAELKHYCDDVRIDFLATPFGLQELDVLVGLGVPAIKIASPDIINIPLLRAAASTQLPLFVSTGASLITEIDQAVAVIRERQTAEHLVLFHCVSAYPTPMTQARLRCIRSLSRRFQVPAGFSDHTAEATTSALAVAAGATVLEKHITLDKNDQGPDHSFSLEPSEFARYVSTARETHAALGDGRFVCAAAELEVRKLARGSLTTSCPITSGQEITSTVLTVRRPSGGIEPNHWEEVLGRRARIDIPANTPLAWSMLQ